MDAHPAHANDTSVNSPAPVVPMLRAVLLCDIVESTALVERLGDARAAGLMQHHDQLLRQADQAMYRAKVAGRNRIEFAET